MASVESERKTENNDEDQNEKGKVVASEIQVGKVIDAALYGTDIMTDCIQFVQLRLKCHKKWAIYTVAFILMPAVAETIGLTFQWYTWMRKAWLGRLPLSCFFFAIFLTLSGFLANVVIPSEDPEDLVHTWVLRPLFVAFLLVLVTVFVKTIVKTMEGYSALVLRRVEDDGTLPEEKMVNAVKGKLTEVVCETAPQSVIQVLFSIQKKCKQIFFLKHNSILFGIIVSPHTLFYF